MPDQSEKLHYEHPLSERIRTFLRVEFLAAQGRFGLEGDSEWHSRIAVTTLAETLDLFGRGDLKTELIKELERLTTTFNALRENPGVDDRSLSYYVSQCEGYIERLKTAQGQLGARLKQDELLNSVIQRSGIPGGTCVFDLPAYHRWLSQPVADRRQDLEQWFDEVRLVQEASELVIGLIRDSARPSSETAREGVYQRSLEKGTPYQMVRVALPRELRYFPEISGSRLFVTVRFMEQASTAERPVRTEDDVPFELYCCVL